MSDIANRDQNDTDRDLLAMRVTIVLAPKTQIRVTKMKTAGMFAIE